MLYLPPHVAHWGIAVGDCMTYSIGFRAPSAQELVAEFLNYLQEKSSADTMYVDPDLRPQPHPAEIGADMLTQVADMLQELQWDKQDVSRFLGRYLSSPKPYVVFDQPVFVSEEEFRERLGVKGISLARKSQLLYCGESLFLNGEEVHAGGVEREMKLLADDRQLPAGTCNKDPLVKMLHAWYLDGYLQFPDE
jgi:50S ribosomal protein L16 3-hydroxylase